jgi:hypothetical protein
VRTRRDAANVAAARWEVFLGAEAQVRGFAFASYVTVLDAEEAAAKELAPPRSIAFIARTSILAPRSDREERRLGTRWRTQAPCRLPPAGRTRRPCAAAPWVSSRSSSVRICFSSASETRLRLTYSPQPGHVPRSPAHEKGSRRSRPRPSVIASPDRRSSRRTPHLVSGFHAIKCAAWVSARKRRV